MRRYVPPVNLTGFYLVEIAPRAGLVKGETVRKLALSALTAATVVGMGPHAYAHPTYHWTGGCMWWGVSDGTANPQTEWNGEMRAIAIALDATGTPSPTTRIDIECELRINGATPGTVVMSASGTGVAASVQQLVYNAHPDDVVTMCDHVTVGDERHVDCGDGTPITLVPHAVQDEVQNYKTLIDGALCGTLASLHNSPANQPPLLGISSDGDVYAGPEWVWDCPPHGNSGAGGGGGDVLAAVETVLCIGHLHFLHQS